MATAGVDLLQKRFTNCRFELSGWKKLLKENSYRHGALVWVFFSIGFYLQNLKFNWNLIYNIYLCKVTTYVSKKIRWCFLTWGGAKGVRHFGSSGLPDTTGVQAFCWEHLCHYAVLYWRVPKARILMPQSKDTPFLSFEWIIHNLNKFLFE